MTKRQRQIVVGCILGDGFIQKTGKRNARLRLEHSLKQKEYIFWKWRELERYMQDRPKYLKRFNPFWRKSYAYYRCQSHSSPIFGKLHEMFYIQKHKQFPESLKEYLTPLSLAVWFMDDGYYYVRDRTAYIYLPKLRANNYQTIKSVFSKNFALPPKLEKKKTGAINFKFFVKDTKKLIKIIAPHIISSMRYKIGEKPRID